MASSGPVRFLCVKMSALQKELLKKGTRLLPPHSMPPPQASLSKEERRGRRGRKDYSPICWSHHFDSERTVTINSNHYHIYIKGSEGPLVYLLHGGGHSGLSWAVFTSALYEMVQCQVIALDMRGHGKTVTEDEKDLSGDVLVNDVAMVFNELFKDTHSPPTLLMGHSMGGAIAVRVAASGLIQSLVGLSVIDVVEGSAMESLSSMQSFLRGRPSVFPSLENAIEWSIRSGQLRNVESARVSMPGQLKRVEKDSSTVISKEGDESSSVTPPTYEYSWRLDLTQTECFWKGWFEGLSKLTLSTSVPKIIILAGVDRLDKELTIGHMQGKLQVQVLNGCGHAVHEDVPDKVAHIVASFLIRYKLSSPKESFSSFPTSSVPMC